MPGIMYTPPQQGSGGGGSDDDGQMEIIDASSILEEIDIEQPQEAGDYRDVSELGSLSFVFKFCDMV